MKKMIHLTNNQTDCDNDKFDCDRILVELSQHLIQEENNRKFKNNQHREIINNLEKEDDMSSSTVNIIVNKYTRNFVNSSIASDVIQGSLEFNNYLINKMLENSSKLSLSEHDFCVNMLWKNLKKLSKSADQHVKSTGLIKNNKYCQIYSKVKSKESKHKNPSGLVITIDKSILEEFPEK